MMDQLLLIKTNEDNNCYILEVLESLLGKHIEYQDFHGVMKIHYHSSMGAAILDSLKSLEGDLNITLSTYHGCNDERLLGFILPTFLDAEYGHYDLKSLLKNAKLIGESAELLDYLLEGTGVSREVLIAMAEYDLNVSKAASALYMHRNTLLYKIDRLNELKSFDLKKFYDLYILIKLMKS